MLETRTLSMRKTRIHRRTLLRGLGTVSVGLPFMEEMLPSTAIAATQKAIPVRAFNVFFGLTYHILKF